MPRHSEWLFENITFIAEDFTYFNAAPKHPQDLFEAVDVISRASPPEQLGRGAGEYFSAPRIGESPVVAPSESNLHERGRHSTIYRLPSRFLFPHILLSSEAAEKSENPFTVSS